MPTLEQSVIILIFASIICMSIIGYYAIRLIKSLTELSNNANEIATSVQKELEPTLQELKEAAKSINSIANSADEKFQNSKANIASIIGIGACLGGKLKSFSQGIMKGVSFGLNLFKK